MGGCVSCRKEDGVDRPKSRRRRNRRRIMVCRMRIWSRKGSYMEPAVAAEESANGDSQCTYANPIFREMHVLGSQEEVWFDATLSMESDCDEDFHSAKEDVISLNGFDIGPMLSVTPFKDATFEEITPYGLKISTIRHSTSCQSSREHTEVSPVYADEIVSGGGILDNCGIIPSNCLPCLVPPEKRSSFSSSPPGSRKKSTLRLSFKWKSGEGHWSNAILGSKSFIERPIAASQVPFCSIEKDMPDCWSNIEPGTFKVRGENYIRDKKKEFAPNCAAYYPFGVDVFLCQQKIDHIARFIKLPSVDSLEKFPSILVINVQIPLYPAAIFQAETNGEGMSYVLYFRLSENFSKEFPSHFQENLRKIIDDEVEKVKGFAVDTIVPVRERIKILGRVMNIEGLHLSAAERKLMHAYNEKPVLSRPQHEFYSGDDYFEIDIDMHRFSYISRKGFEAFMDKLKICVLDLGLTIQGNKAEELPEHILCCVRLNQINHSNYPQLVVPCS